MWVRNFAEMPALHYGPGFNFCVPFLQLEIFLSFMSKYFIKLGFLIQSFHEFALSYCQSQRPLWNKEVHIQHKLEIGLCGSASVLASLVTEFSWQIEAKLQKVWGARLGCLTKCESLLILIWSHLRWLAPWGKVEMKYSLPIQYYLICMSKCWQKRSFAIYIMSNCKLICNPAPILVRRE